jgi:hypothetical protein
MNNGCKDDGGDGKDRNDADIIILEDLTHSAERLHLSSPKKKLNDAREKAAYFEKEVSYILDIMLPYLTLCYHTVPKSLFIVVVVFIILLSC